MSSAHRKTRHMGWLAPALLVLTPIACQGPLDERSAGSPPPRTEGYAEVERVVDGDTVVLLADGSQATPARLIGVDTPESTRESECFGKEASGFVRGMLPPGTVVHYRLGEEPRDRYDRALVYLWKGDGRKIRESVNARLLKEGYAETLTVPPNNRYKAEFAEAEREARTAGRGLWSTCGGPDDAAPFG